ncbi:MAG: MtaA/CmuA family methyltransferase [Caldilineales bacterium]|nr:MtaA/CmuA family methyltransferase [Caldilineales bacterium]
MNAKTRFMNALHLQPVDRLPVAAVVTGITVGMMEKAGIHYPEAHKDAEQLAGLAASIWEYSHIEAIKLPFGMTPEVEALGLEIDFGTYDTLPTDIHPIWNHPDELVIPDDFFSRGRIPVVMEAISRLRDRYGDEVAILTSSVGPFVLSAKMFGFPNLFPWIINEPDYVHRIMDQLTELTIAHANAQLAAGSDVILLGEATCSGDLISPETYRDFILPYHQRLCANINGPTILHICGKSTKHLPFIAETGATGYSFDEGIDMAEARKYLKGKVALAGYVPTVEVLLNGSPELVYQASLECLGNGVDILAPGCSLPQHTTDENVAAMIRAAEDWAASPELRQSIPDVIRPLKQKKRTNGGDASAGRRTRRQRVQ